MFKLTINRTKLYCLPLTNERKNMLRHHLLYLFTILVFTISPLITCADEKEDFNNLFTKKGQGTYMKYMYQVPRDSLYIEDDSDYYPFDEEVNIINQNIQQFADLVGRSANIIDIGPGASHAVESKVLSFIGSLNNPLSYTSIDIELKYALDAPKIVRERFPNLVVSGIATDLTTQEGMNYTSVLRRLKNKSILCFGSLFGNFDDAYRKDFIKYISNLMNAGDIFIIDIDTNQNADEVYKAYNNKNNNDILLNVMRYFKINYKVDDFDPEAFKIERKWEMDKTNNVGYIKAYAVALEDQKFSWEGKSYKIRKNDKYFLTFSAKFSKAYIEQLASKNKLQVKEVLKNDDSRINIFVLTKIP